MVDLGTYKDRFAESGQRIFEHAMQDSKSRDQNYIAVEHILNAFITEEAELFNSAMRDLSLDPFHIKMQIERRLDDNRFQHVGKGLRIAPETIDLFKRAMERSRAQGRKTIESTDLFSALAQDGGLLSGVLRTLGADSEALTENVRARVRLREQDEEQYRKKFELPPYLKHFGTSMNRLARMDKIAPTIGREREIQQMVEILCHRERANSPMLVGEPGVGKTAVVEGLARIIELEPEKVPARLRNAHIVQLQMGGLVAGTMLRGMFEERIKGIIDEVKERPDLILFIDEAHTIIGAGAALGTSSDAANMFKSSLARGDLRIIGATTIVPIAVSRPQSISVSEIPPSRPTRENQSPMMERNGKIESSARSASAIVVSRPA